MAPAIEEKEAFKFTSEQTIGDLLLAAAVLEKAGHRPSLRFVKSYPGNADCVALHFDAPEMAVTEG